MAKIQKALVKLSGKLGEQVHVNKGPYDPHVRDAPKKKKKLPKKLTEQSSLTGAVNRLAGEVNNIIRGYSDNFKPHDFYRRVRSRICKNQPPENRFLQLYKLKGLEVHEKHTFSKLGLCKATVSKVKNKTIVSLFALSHPRKYRPEANCYYYEVLLITWSSKTDEPIHERQLSDWIKLNDDEKEFEFVFRQPAGATHWMLCLRQRLGCNDETIGAFNGEGMLIYDVGTFDAAEAKLLAKKIAEEKEKERIAKLNSIKQVKEVVRVKAKVKK
jgi:hypothetical protein